MQYLSFEVATPELLIVAEVAADTVVSERDISQFIKSSPYNKLELDKAKVKEFVAACLLAKEQATENEASERVEQTIGEVQNAELKVTISSDKMRVEAEVYTAIGGQALDLDAVKTACIDAGVRFGLKTSLVEQLLSDCHKAEPGSVIKSLVGQGQAAKPGKNARFKPLVKLFSESMRRPKKREDGSVDLRDLGNIATVEVGQAILKKLPLTEGTPGRDVYGEKIPAEPGQDAELKASESTEIDSDDPNLLRAKKAGLARFDGTVMEVDDILVYKQLDPKQGHVKFKGSVVIRGDVSPDMRLVATGDVVIGGFVECATIKCGGELTILSGASGRQVAADESDNKGPKYNCKLVSGGQINLAFANQCEITAKNLVNIGKQISHCNVEADSMVVGTGAKPGGQVSGGRYYLCKGLQAGTIGTESNVHCDISLNRTYDIFMAKESELSGGIDALEGRLEKLDAEINRVMDPKAKADLEEQKKPIQAKIEKHNGYRSALMAKRREYMEQVKIDVFRTLYPKVTFYIGDKVLLTDEIKGPSQVHVVDYELLIEPL